MIASFTHQARFILAIGLLLGQIIRVSSQGTVDASDLPSCAGSCASTAAIAAGCTLTDTACLCSHPAFADATRQCAGSACSIEDSSSVNGVLNNMCPSSNTSSSPASSSTSGTATSPSQSSRSASASQGTSSPNSSASSTGTASSNTQSTPIGTVYTVSSQSQSSSSTVLVVQTVVLPQTTNFSGAVSRDFGVVGLGLVGQVVIALVGGVLLL